MPQFSINTNVSRGSIPAGFVADLSSAVAKMAHKPESVSWSVILGSGCVPTRGHGHAKYIRHAGEFFCGRRRGLVICELRTGEPVICELTSHA